MSYPVVKTLVGKKSSKNLFSFAQSVIIIGHKAEENHVSKTPGSSTQFFPVGALTPTYKFPF
jgi:hypothetical protein